MENGTYIKGELGTPQGSILSPVLANIYMYYVLILWFEKEVKPKYKGFIEVVNYADDMVVCFQNKTTAEEVYKQMEDRLKECGLKFAKDKTRLIEFGRFASENRKRKGLGKPETFDFLGFTHYCSKSKDKKRFRVKRKTSKKKYAKKLQEYNVWVKNNIDKSLKEIVETTKRKLIGHYNYFGITDNSQALVKYNFEVIKILFKWLNRRSQRKSYTWDEFNQMLKVFQFPKPKIKVNIYAIWWIILLRAVCGKAARTDLWGLYRVICISTRYAYYKIQEIFNSANNNLVIIDAYADNTILDIIKRLKIKVTIITKSNNLLTEQDIAKYNKQYNNLQVYYNNTFHDRYFILDDEIIYHCGASINRIGYKTFSITLIGDEDVKNTLINKIKKIDKEN